jgi:hypothetical protein
MNVSAACPQCGAIANPNDKFCNTCGTPLQRAGGGPSTGVVSPPPAQPQYAPAPGQPQYAASPQPQYAQAAFPQQPGYPPPGGEPPAPPPPQYGAPAPRATRCQLGHAISPGMSYCAQGHPIALDAMQFAGDPSAAYAPQAPPPPPPYGAPGGYGQPGGPPPFEPARPAPAQGLGFGGPPAYQPAPPTGAPQGGFGGGGYPAPAPPPQQPVFQPAPVAPPAPQYAPPPAPGGYAHEPGPAPVPAGAKQLRGFVVTFQSNPAGDFWPLSTGRTTVGRANAPEPADIALADATISSRHAAFNVDANTVVVEDTNSTNGTYVNEEHVGQNGRRELRDGDRVRFGGFSTIVKLVGRA